MQVNSVVLVTLLSVVVAVFSARATGATLPLKSEISSTYNHTFTFGFSGGAPFCSQCGSPGAFACSNQPNWVATRTFTDYRPAQYGGSVLGAYVVFTGSYACTSPVTTTTVAVSLNGVIVDVLNLNGGQLCKCNTCDGTVTFSKIAPLGWPTYYGDGSSSNNLTVTVYTGSICLNNIALTLNYGQATYPLKTAYSIIPWGANGRSTNGICGSSQYAEYSGSTSFYNPLPAKSMVYSVDVEVFGTYFYYGNQCLNTSVGVSINNFPVATNPLYYPRQYGSSNVVTRPCRNFGCDGHWLFSMQQLYQNGIPNYNYNGYNTLTFSGSYSTQLAFATLWLYYLPPNGNVLEVN